MKASEILRKLADMIDGQETGMSDRVPHQDQSAELHPVEIDNNDNTESNLMVPPLQQKLELMKKLAGEEGCSECGGTPCECEDEDEMSIMKRNAGIPTAFTVAVADEDEPFDG